MIYGILVRHELSQLFKSRTLYISLFVCYGICGFITWISPFNIPDSGIASATPVFTVLYWLELLILPVITLRNLAYEKASGILELMLTSPVKIRDIIIAKWISSWLISLLLLLLSLPYCITISNLGNLDWSSTICGYIALAMHGGLVTAVCLFSSSITKTPHNTLFITWIISTAVTEIPSVLTLFIKSGIVEFLLLRISAQEYFNYMIRGSFYLHCAVLYFLLTALFIIFACSIFIYRQEYPRKPVRYLIAALIIVLSAGASVFTPYRFDFSGTRRYSLSPVTKQTVRDNHMPVSVNIYYSDNLPENSFRILRELGMLLRSYRAESTSDFKINVTRVNNAETRHAAELAGIAPVFSEDGENKNGEAVYFGAAFAFGNYIRSSIEHINANTALEYEITRIIKQASDPKRPSVGMVYGHGECDARAITLFINEVTKNADLEMVNLGFESSLNEFNVLCIIGAQHPFTEHEIAALTEYLHDGGRLFIALRHARGEIRDPKGSNWFTINRTGLENMLEEMGMKINYDFVIDNNCGTLTIQQPTGSIFSTGNIKFPFFPRVTHLSEHVITSGLNAVMLPFASSIDRVKTSTTYAFKELARTSYISGTLRAPVLFNLKKTWDRGDFKNPGKTVAAMLTDEDNGSAVIAVSNAAFLLDDIVSMYGQDNINFALNSIEWLEDNSGLIQLRNKYTTFPTLEKLSDNATNMVKTLNFMLPLLLVSAMFAGSAIIEKTRFGRRRY